MDYDKQRTFLTRQRWRLLPAATGCGIFLVQAARAPMPTWARVAGEALSLGLFWGAYYLPNYLGMNANPQRRLRWLARGRWVALSLLGLLGLVIQAKIALASVVAAAALHLVLLRFLHKPLPLDLRQPDPRWLQVIAAVYAAADFAALWLARRGGAPVVLVDELLVCFAFLATVVVRPRSGASHAAFGAVAAGLSFLLSADAATAFFSGATAAAVFLWTAGTAHLLAKAAQQNLENYDDLVQNLETFYNEPRENIVRTLIQSVAQLAEDWERWQPKGQAAVTAWYRRNARLYLFANCQHHLLYKHIVYTLGLLELARGRVLDFGGGNGDFSRALARKGCQSTYLDVAGDAANYLRWRATREALPLGIAHDLDELEGLYDTVYSLDVIEHLVDLAPVFARLKKLLRPGGWLVATYYNGPTSSAPMHIDPGFDARDFLVAQGFRDVKATAVGLLSPELMRKNHFMILENRGS